MISTLVYEYRYLPPLHLTEYRTLVRLLNPNHAQSLYLVAIHIPIHELHSKYVLYLEEHKYPRANHPGLKKARRVIRGQRRGGGGP